MDGPEKPYTQYWSAKFQEVQKYLSSTGHVYTPAYALVSEQHYAALPEDVRSVLDRCGQETQGFVYETDAKMETDLLDKLKAGGIAVNEADKDAFIAASKPIYAHFGDSVDRKSLQAGKSGSVRVGLRGPQTIQKTSHKLNKGQLLSTTWI